MLPFVFLDETKLGPFHPYGIFCAIGLLSWDSAIMWHARRRGYEAKDFRVLTLWVFLTGCVFAWLIDAVFYHPPGRSVTSTLLSLQGASSTGGLVGATIGAFIWCHVYIRKEAGSLRVSRREKPESLLAVTEMIVATWPIAWAFGRLGCAVIHDHPGIVVPHGTLASVFAVAWPRGPTDGVHHILGPLHVVTGGADARFDLGLLEFFVLTAIAIAFASTWKKEFRLGTYTIIGALTYGPIRFGLDFLRIRDGAGGDARFGGLTFAQYWSLAVIGLGLTLLAKRWRKDRHAIAAKSVAALVLITAALAPRSAAAAAPWVDRPMTLPRLVFAGDFGVGVAHAKRPAPVPDPTGVGLNIEAALGVIDTLELGFRTGVRLGDEARAVQADSYGRTNWTETYGTTTNSSVANPEFRVRWVALGTRIIELGLDGRVYLPIESGARAGIMFGVPITFHLRRIARIDTGAYIPVVFYSEPATGVSIPGYFWFQVTDKVWLGPMTGLRFVNPSIGPSHTDLLLGFGLGVQVASAVDLKTMLFMPRVNGDDNGRTFGAGFGVQLRIE